MKGIYQIVASNGQLVLRISDGGLIPTRECGDIIAAAPALLEENQRLRLLLHDLDLERIQQNISKLPPKVPEPMTKAQGAFPIAG